jgi:NAD dependent epimerase/dehydratase family enzyme
VVKVLLGELGERALLEGALVKPRRLEEVGFRFEFPSLESALRHELGRAGARRFTLAGRTAELLP